MKIAISGSFSVGKTTLCRLLAERIQRQGVNVEIIPESARAIIARGYHVDLKICPVDVFAYIATQLAAERVVSNKNYIIADRWLLDLYAFLSSDAELPLLSDRSAICASVEEIVRTRLDFYDQYIYVLPGVPIVNDGIRDFDPIRQQAFATALLDAYDHLRIKPVVFNPLSGNIDLLLSDLEYAKN